MRTREHFDSLDTLVVSQPLTLFRKASDAIDSIFILEKKGKGSVYDERNIYTCITRTSCVHTSMQSTMGHHYLIVW